MSYFKEHTDMISNMNIMFNMQENVNVKSTDYSDAMIGNWTDSPLSIAFFSGENIDILQNGLRAGVYNMSNGKHIIERQNENELKIIMRSVFLQKSKNRPDGITQQIETLYTMELLLIIITERILIPLTYHLNHHRLHERTINNSISRAGFKPLFFDLCFFRNGSNKCLVFTQQFIYFIHPDISTFSPFKLDDFIL